MRFDNEVIHHLFQKVANKHRNFHLVNKKDISGHSLAIGKPGKGKCQPKGSKVLMCDGSWRKIEDVKIGDRIISPQEDGSFTFAQIINIHSRYEKEIYDIYERNRDKKYLYSVAWNHEIPVFYSSHPRKRDSEGNTTDKRIAIRKSSNLEARYVANLKGDMGKISTFSTSSIEYLRVDEDIEPYCLGIWLGDGHYSKYNNIGITCHDDNKARMDYFKKVYTDEITSVSSTPNRTPTYRIRFRGKFAEGLRRIGLERKNSGTKFIPKKCLLSSIDYRKKLLAGLIDTDGNIGKNNGINYTTKSKKLAEGIEYLVFSLGGHSRVYEIYKIFQGIRRRYYIVKVSFKDASFLPLQLQRKKERIKIMNHEPRNVKIILKRKKSGCQIYGIEIDKNESQSAWYITDNWMVTHNTSSNRREVELRWRANQKVFCLYDAGRCDMGYFMFPSVSPFWKKPKIDGNKIVTARSYPTELLYPVTKNMPKKLPFNAKPFTIAVSDLDEDDIVSLTGFQSRETIKGMLNYMEDFVDDETTAEDYIHIMSAGLKKSSDSDSIKPSHHGAKKLKYDVFKPLINEGLLSSKKVSTAVDIRSMIKDRHTISVLILRHCPQKLWGFLAHYFANHIYKNLIGMEGDKMIRVPTTIVFNEVPDLLTTGGEESGESGIAISKLISRIAKQSRTGNLFMLLDAQLPQELPDVRNIMQRVYVFNSSVPEIQKAMEISGITTRTGMINQDDLSLIPFLPSGYYYLFYQGGVAFQKLAWTRSRTYLEGDDFYEIYDRVYGKSSYVSVLEILKELKEEKKESEATWEYRKELLEKVALERGVKKVPKDEQIEQEIEEGDPEEHEEIEELEKETEKKIKKRTKKKPKEIEEKIVEVPIPNFDKEKDLSWLAPDIRDVDWSKMKKIQKTF